MAAPVEDHELSVGGAFGHHDAQDHVDHFVPEGLELDFDFGVELLVGLQLALVQVAVVLFGEDVVAHDEDLPDLAPLRPHHQVHTPVLEVRLLLDPDVDLLRHHFGLTPATLDVLDLGHDLALLELELFQLFLLLLDLQFERVISLKFEQIDVIHE